MFPNFYLKLPEPKEKLISIILNGLIVLKIRCYLQVLPMFPRFLLNVR